METSASGPAKLLFICGVHRSGTSLVRDILGSHPEVSRFVGTGAPEDEGQHLQSVFPSGLTFGGPGRFGFDPRAHMNETHDLATPDSAARLWAEWSPLWDVGKRLLVEKSPPNIVRMRFLQALFPGAAFLVILRHPAAVAYATQKWCADPLHRLIEHTLRCYEIAMSDLRFIERAHVLRYEDLIRAPHEEVGAILRFAGLDGRRLDLAHVTSVAQAGYLERWRRERDAVLLDAEHSAPGWFEGIPATASRLGLAL